MRSLWRLFAWFVVADLLITIFGVTTAPVLLCLALDAAVGLLVIRSYMEVRARLAVAVATTGEPKADLAVGPGPHGQSVGSRQDRPVDGPHERSIGSEDRTH